MNDSIPFSVNAKNMPTDLRRVCRQNILHAAAIGGGVMQRYHLLHPNRREPSAGEAFERLGASARFRMTPRYQANIGESLAQERFSWP